MPISTRIIRVLSSLLAKGVGAGSRGGQVIGQTSSGRPIYARRGSGHGAYAGFSAADHFSAAKEHLGRVGRLRHRLARQPDPALALRADQHMAHYTGHLRRAKALNSVLPAAKKIEALS